MASYRDRAGCREQKADHERHAHCKVQHTIVATKLCFTHNVARQLYDQARAVKSLGPAVNREAKSTIRNCTDMIPDKLLSPILVKMNVNARLIANHAFDMSTSSRLLVRNFPILIGWYVVIIFNVRDSIVQKSV